MQIYTDQPLAAYSTMRLGGIAKALTEIRTKAELVQALEWANSRNMPVLTLGGGSNIIFKDGFGGLIILIRIPGFEVVSDTKESTIIRIGAGENWDSVVARTVDMNLSGIEALSAIPGTAGATPVQNVGAYGQEIADTFVELEAYHLPSQQFVSLHKEECQFTYRGSRFKSPDHREYIITSLTLQLRKQSLAPPFYAALQKYLDENDIDDFSPKTIRRAVTAIRATKLPDPTKLANTGSFFKNPIIPASQAKALITSHPDIPHWPTKDGRVKFAAGWLIEHAGLKGYHAHGMKIYEHNALVFVNESATSYEQLATFCQEVVDKVSSLFSIKLEQEPELL